MGSLVSMENEATRLFDRLTASAQSAGEQLTPGLQAELPTNTLQTGRCAARNKQGNPGAAPPRKGLTFA